MGKKGGPKGKGKPVVMTQAEFFQQTSGAGAVSSTVGSGGWEGANIFGQSAQPKPKVVAASMRATEDEQKATLQNAID